MLLISLKTIKIFCKGNIVANTPAKAKEKGLKELPIYLSAFLLIGN